MYRSYPVENKENNFIVLLYFALLRPNLSITLLTDDNESWPTHRLRAVSSVMSDRTYREHHGESGGTLAVGIGGRE